MARFIKSATKASEWINDEKPEVCFVGRSNVGKSSLINSLAGESIARTAKTPGRTRLINFFDFDSFRLIDLPGYGYAKVSQEAKEQFNIMIDEYLNSRENLKAIYLICDCKVITENDKVMLKFIEKKFKNVYVILNKFDQLNKSEKDKLLVTTSNYFKISTNQIIPVSAKKNENIKTLYSAIIKNIKIK